MNQEAQIKLIPARIAVRWLLAHLRLSGEECFEFDTFCEAFKEVHEPLSGKVALSEDGNRILTPLKEGLISCTTLGICNWKPNPPSPICLTMTKEQARLIYLESRLAKPKIPVATASHRLRKRYYEITS